jgi:CelD/BcsL family acetyltransferase involved in cellulose biosynthesis
LPWPLLWFETAPLAAPRWQKFLAALQFVGASFAANKKFDIGTIEIATQLHHNWEAYQAAWSGNHRRHMRKALRKANEEGGVELDVCRPTSPSEVERLLLDGFEVEHRSWKGGEHTSVLCHPQVLRFYQQQATALAQHGLLELTFLRYEGQSIAFEYGWRAKETYFTPKVGYDNAYARFSPGQLLRYLRFERAFAQRELRRVDFLGPLSDATAKWATSTYPVSRLVVETGGSGGRALLWAYQNLWGPVRHWRKSDNSAGQFEIVRIDSDVSAPLPA